jgi:(p)ppGpp synthase/HD superfamily hydrolase
MEWQRDLKDSKEFLETLRVDLFPDEVYVFTPRGDVRQFPKGATPIDFAFAIHTDVGLRCVGAKISGRLVPLRTELQNGDIVEIVTSPNHVPSRTGQNRQTHRAGQDRQGSRTREARASRWVVIERRSPAGKSEPVARRMPSPA